jgi:drug/metabolite transporter (DMT)-like permease
MYLHISCNENKGARHLGELQSETVLSANRPLKLTRWKGILMVLVAATLWGVSGTAAQVLFQSFGFEPGWLVTVRMGVSGFLLVLSGWLSSGIGNTCTIWKNRNDAVQVVIYAVLGLVGVQYSYFASIHLGNAATATILQYLGPVLITIYMTLRYRRLPTLYEGTAVLLAILGTCLLVTNGEIGKLSISAGSLVWGLISAVALAFYTVFPAALIRKYGAASVVGWAMLIGSILFSLYTRPWYVQGVWTTFSAELVVFVVLFGTLIPFFLYLESLRYITPSETGVLGCAEPLSSVLVAVLFLHVKLGTIALLGGFCIILTVGILAKKSA